VTINETFITIASAIFGLIIGSFLSVCIFRIPYGRTEESLEGSDQAEDNDAKPATEPETDEKQITIANPPRSFCPSCEKELRWFHNIPLFSWIFLGGKCAYCKASISFRYPLVEILSALFCVLSFKMFGLSFTAFVTYAFSASLIVISFIDYDYYIIPNVISLPGTLLGIVLSLVNTFYPIFNYPLSEGIKDSLLGILAGAGFLLVVSEGYLRLRKKEGLGMGDVKLLAMTGAFFGVSGALYTIFVGSVLGSLLGILFLLAAGKKMTHQLPFGPYLALGTLLYIYVGPQLVTLVLGFFGVGRM